MDHRTLLLAVAMGGALATAFPSTPARAPLPSDQALARLSALAPPPEPSGRVRMVAKAERHCLALNVYWESRGEPRAGQEAVAHVTLNRRDAAGYPATLCGVVYQGCQFGWTCDDVADQPAAGAAWAEALAAADAALAGKPDPTGGALYFHGVAERPRWVQGRYGHRQTIGGHVFFNVEEDREVAEAR